MRVTPHGDFPLFLNDSRRITHHRCAIRHILKDNSSSTDSDMVTYVNSPKYGSPRIDFHIVSNSRPSTFSIAQRHHLQAIEIVSDRFGIEISSVTMFEMSPLPDMWTPNSHRSLWRKQPGNKYRAIFPQSIIKKIAEAPLPGTSLHEVENRRLVVLHHEQIGIDLLLMKQIQGYVGKHPHRRSRQYDSLCYWIHIAKIQQNIEIIVLFTEIIT